MPRHNQKRDEWRQLAVDLALHLALRPTCGDRGWETKASELVTETKLALAIDEAQSRPQDAEYTHPRVPTIFAAVAVA